MADTSGAFKRPEIRLTLPQIYNSVPDGRAPHFTWDQQQLLSNNFITFAVKIEELEEEVAKLKGKLEEIADGEQAAHQ